MDDIYQDGKYKEANPSWHDEDAPWKARQVYAIIQDNKVPFQTVGEVGCGAGGILVELSKMFPHATFAGYDISPQSHELATRRERPRVKFQLKDALQEADLHFDLVLVIDVIEHVEDYIGFTKKVKKLGHFKIFHIPLDLSVQSLLRMWPILNLRENVGHIHYFNKDTAIALLKDCGYKVISWRYTASRLELPNQAFSSRLMAAPRRLSYHANPDLAVRVLGGYSLLVLAE